MVAVAGFVGGLFSFSTTAAVLGAAAVPAAWAGAGFAATVVGGLAVKLLSTVAISALTSALAHEPAQGGGLTISTTLRGEQNPETIILGRYATAGQAIAAPYTHGENNGYLTHVVELCSAPGATLNRVMIGDEWMPIGSTPHPDHGYPLLGESDAAGRIWVRYYDGTQTVADPHLREVYGSHPDRPWSADMVGQGICYAIITFDFHRKRLNQVPRYRFELDGIPLYDIRRDSTAGGSGSQRLANPATWTQTDNPAVIAWNIMRGIPLPGGERYGGAISDLSELPQQMWVTAMNRCDAAMEIAGGGSEPQYRAGLEVALNQPPAAALEEIFKACSATIADLGHGWGIVVGAPALPVMSFSDDDIIVSKPQELEPFPALEATWNAVSARYPEPDELYETKEAPQRTNAAWEASDAFGRRMANLSLPAVPYRRQVQRLMRAWIEDERRFRRHNLSLPPDSAHVEPTDTVSWTSERNGYAAKTFSVHKIVEDPRTGIRSLSLRERDPGDYAWVPSYELPSTPTTPGTTPALPDGVAGFTVTPISLTDAAGIPRRAGIALGWSPTIIAEGLQWQLRLAGQAGVELSGATVDIEAGGLRLLEGILPATDYQVRAQLISRRRTAWTAWLAVTTPNIRLTTDDLDTTPPPVPTGLVLSSTPGVLAADWDASPAADLAYYDIELTEGAGNAISFQTGLNRHRWSPVAPNASFTVRIRAVDRLGNRSLWTAPVSHTVAGDTVPPAVPTGLAVTPGFGTLWLRWNPNAEADLSHYEIYQSTTTTAPAAGATPTYRVEAATISVTGLGEAVTRHFWLRAVDTSGNRSAWSARVQGQTSSIWTHVTDAAVPAGLALASVLDGANAKLTATWTASVNAVSYELGITEGAGNEVVIGAGELRHEWGSVPGRSWSARIRAVNAVGRKSAWSAVQTITADRDSTPPAVPAGLVVTPAFKGFWLEWTPNAETDFSHYELVWRPTAWTPDPMVAADLSTTSAKVSLGGLADATTRFYRLRAVDTSGNRSAWSDAVSATTLSEIDTTITGADLAGLIDATSFAQGIEPVSVIASGPLPTVKSTSAIVWGGKLYRWTGSAYSASAATSDLTGQIVSAQIATGAVKAAQIDAGAIIASKLAIGDFTNLVPDSEVIDSAAWTLQTGVSFDAAAKCIIFPGAWVGTRSANSAIFPVEAGAEYFLSAVISTTDAAAVGNLRLQLRWLNAAGGWLSWSPFTDEAVPQNGEKLIERSYAAPVGAVGAVLYAQAMNGTSAALTMTKPVVRRKGSGKLFVDGSLKAVHMAAEEIISLSAQIRSAIITDAHITTLSAGKLTAGTALTGSLTVNGSALSSIGANAALGAQDPASRINAGNTRIDPGRVLISGTTALSSWIGGPDLTEINGGKIAANSVRANTVEIGSRGISLSATRFEADPATNTVTWTAGKVHWIDDAGVAQATDIAAGSFSWTNGTTYLCWNKGEALLAPYGNLAIANNKALRVIIATYAGGRALNPEYGRTMIDGGEIRTGSIRAANLIQTEELITQGAQIGQATITTGHIVSLDAGKIIAGSTLSGSVTVNDTALNTLAEGALFDKLDADWVQFSGAGSVYYSASNVANTVGNRVMVARADGPSWVESPSKIALDPNRLYRVSVQLRRAGAAATPAGNMYLGLAGYAEDKITRVNTMGENTTGYHHYFVANRDQGGIGTSYETFVSYYKGRAATPGGAGTIANPRTLHENVRYVAPMALFNYATTTGTLMVLGFVRIEAVDEDAAGVVNAGSVQIDAGKITISGGSTLADWRRGGDETRIDGGALSANTVSANKLEIGSRNITLTGVQFEHNKPGANQVSWSAGQVRWVNDAGATTSTGVAAGNASWTSGILYIYWAKGAAVLAATTSQATAFAVDNVILATYQGGKLLDPDYGRTVIDGSDIKTGTITATQLIQTAALITTTAQMGNAVVDTLSIAGNAVTVPVSASASSEIILETTGTEVTLISVVLQRQAVPTMLWATCQMGGYDTQSIARFHLYRGGDKIASFPGVTGSKGTQTALAFSWRDANTDPGSSTFALRAERAVEGDYTGRPQILNRSLIAMQVRR